MTRKTTSARPHARTILLLSGLALLITGAVLYAGPLDPPAGPVTSTYKTLTEVEPRTAINATNTAGDADSVFRIRQAGSYYLTGNVTGVSGKRGIEIGASGVTIDLNGFRLQGVAGSLNGIATDAARSSIVIRNGTISSWGSDGIDLSSGGNGALIEGVIAASNGGSGVRANDDAVIRSCVAQGNGLLGLFASNNATIVDCTAADNGTNGIEAIGGATITNCSATANNGYGIAIDYGGAITNCIARENIGNGIGGFLGVTISGCSAWRNTGIGITAIASACTVSDCSAYNNDGDGIRCASACIVRGNTCTSNGNGAGIGAGIHATGGNNRIEGNNCTSNDFGIDIDSAGNMIVRNSCASNTQNFVIAIDNVYGPIVNRTAPGSPAVAGNSAAGTMGSTDPNANFAY